MTYFRLRDKLILVLENIDTNNSRNRNVLTALFVNFDEFTLN